MNSPVPLARPRPSSARGGFTLIEMLAVLGLIALVLSIVVVNVGGIFGGGERDATAAKIKGLEVPLLAYRKDVRSFPTTEQGLQALVTAPAAAGTRWKGPYVEPAKLPEDAWGRPFQYRYPGVNRPTSYDLWSLGADGVESADDLNNWDAN